MRSLGICLRTRQALQEDTLESVMERHVRRELVQQMLSATSAIPGSIGERRNMRAELEAMVHQVEAETARAQPEPSSASAQKPVPASSRNKMQPAPSSASAVAAIAKAPDGEDVEFEIRN